MRAEVFSKLRMEAPGEGGFLQQQCAGWYRRSARHEMPP